MRHLALPVALLLAAVLAPPAAQAGPPTDQLRRHVDEVIRTLEDPALKKSPERRRAAVRRISEEIFDYGDTARRALGRHWAARTPQEQAEFVKLFADVLERAYLGRLDQYQGEKVRFTDERLEGREALVKTVITTPRGSQVPVDYRLHTSGGRWRVYDVVIEGVSLVANYRSQFDRIVQTESFESLLRKLRARDGAPAASPR